MYCDDDLRYSCDLFFLALAVWWYYLVWKYEMDTMDVVYGSLLFIKAALLWKRFSGR
jgi:hypothetical protein